MTVLSSLVDVDVRAALPLVHAPTLVMHKTEDRMIPFVLGQTQEFLTGTRPVTDPNRVLATVLLPTSSTPPAMLLRWETKRGETYWTA
jgi:hypothetical protein